MFNGAWKEQGMKEIPIENEKVCPIEFLTLLTVLYPSFPFHQGKVNGKILFKDLKCNFLDYNVGMLLKLSDYFDIPDVLKSCEEILVASETIKDPKKLLLVDQIRSMSEPTKVEAVSSRFILNFLF